MEWKVVFGSKQIIPVPFHFVFDNKEDIFENPIKIESLKIWYVDSGPIYIRDFGLLTMQRSDEYLYCITSQSMSVKSVFEGIKTFYIQYDNCQVNTIFLNVEQILDNGIDQELFSYKEVSLNNNKLEIDQNHLPFLWVLPLS